MPTTLSAGVIHTLVQNEIYALPVVKCMIQASAVCELSLTSSTTGFTAVSATTTGVETVAGFLRCTTAAAVVSVKRT